MKEEIFKRLCEIVSGTKNSSSKLSLTIPKWMSVESGYVFNPFADGPSERIDYDTSVYRYVGNFTGQNDLLIQIGVELMRGSVEMTAFHLAFKRMLFVVTFSHKTKRYTLEETSLDKVSFKESDGLEFLEIVKHEMRPVENFVFQNSVDELIGEVGKINQPIFFE